MLELCERHDLASINRVPLMIGLLTGRWAPDTVLPEDDRSYVQGALGWILAHSHRTIPIPDFRTVEHVKGVAGTLQHGPLSTEQMTAIARHLERSCNAYSQSSLASRVVPSGHCSGSREQASIKSLPPTR